MKWHGGVRHPVTILLRHDLRHVLPTTRQTKIHDEFLVLDDTSMDGPGSILNRNKKVYFLQASRPVLQPPSHLHNGHLGFFTGGLNGRSVKPTTDLYSVPRLRMSADIFLLPLYAFIALTETSCYFLHSLQNQSIDLVTRNQTT
jgi:hypothetical protein